MSLTDEVGGRQPAPISGSWAVVAAVAAVPRVVWAFMVARAPVGLFDPAVYLAAAENIAAGRGYRSLTGTFTSYFPPTYPFFLGALRWIVDLVGLDSHFFVLVGIVQALLGVLACLGVMFIADRIAGRFAGVTAGLLTALWPNLIIHGSLLLSETLFIALLIGCLVVLVRALERWSGSGMGPSDGHHRKQPDPSAVLLIVAAGTLCGLAVLTRPQAGLLVVPALVLAGLLSGAGIRRSALAAALLTMGILLMVLPWGVRNQVRLGSFVPVSTNTGDNLCIGFNPEANGGFAMAPACQADTSYTDGPRAEVSRYRELLESAFTWARSNSGRLAHLSLSKVRITFGSDADGVRVTESFGEDPFLGDRLRSRLTMMSNVYYFGVLALALVGAWLLASDMRRGRVAQVPDSDAEPAGDPPEPNPIDPAKVLGWMVLLIVASSVLVPVLSFGDPRFKVPFEPLLAILAAVTLTQTRDRFLRRGD